MKTKFLTVILLFICFTGAFANGPGSMQETGTSCDRPGQPTCNLTNCTDPNDGFVDNEVSYVCGYSDDAYTGNKRAICSYIYAGGSYPYNNIINCHAHTSAPINSGLIILIMAGAGAGFYTLKKNDKTIAESNVKG